MLQVLYDDSLRSKLYFNFLRRYKKHGFQKSGATVTFELLGFNALRTFREKRNKYDRKSLSEKLHNKIMKIIPIKEEKIK